MSPGPIVSGSTTPTWMASITTSRTTRISAATLPGASSGSAATARFQRTIRGSAARPSLRKRSLTDSKTLRAPRFIPRPEISGRSTTGRRVATRSTSSAAGKDYGWPDVSYGVQYDARQSDGRKNVRVGSGQTSMKGVEEPVYFWVPSIAPSGMMFYTGDLFPEWKGNLFIGAMAGQHLVRLVLDGERVVAEEKLLTDLKQRIREVRQAPDGSIYVFAGAGLLRLTPKK